MNNLRINLSFCYFSLVFLTVAAPTHAQETWSKFQNGGQLESANWKLPTKWTPAEGIAWQTKLAGYGQSSPVVYGDSVYITSVAGANKETINIESFSNNDGKKQWDFKLPNASPEKNTVMVSRAAPTPVVDNAGVVAFFEGGNLVALDHRGKKRWARNLLAEFGALKARHGLAASLEQNKDHVFVWCERMESPYVMAIAKKDGSTKWKVPGVGKTSWASPRLMAVAGQTHLVLSANGAIVGLDPRTGKSLWRFENITGNSSSTPVPVNDGQFLIGSIGGQETGESPPTCGLVQVEKTDAQFTAKWVWDSPKATCSFGSPFAYQGRAYFVNRTGIVYCHQLKTGKQLFVKRLPAGQIWATPLAGQDGIYFFGKGGVTSLIEASDQFKVVSENTLWTEEKPKAPPTNPDSFENRFSGSVLYAAAVHDSTLFLRRGDVLYRLKPVEKPVGK